MSSRSDAALKNKLTVVGNEIASIVVFFCVVFLPEWHI
jgi:hypothetical protein